MPAWNSDLSAPEIEALVGFILEPNGDNLFVNNCGECHEIQALVEIDATELRRALDEGLEYGPHVDLGIPIWSEALSSSDQAKLLNFLTAPDGPRLWTQECAACHGQSVAFGGSRGDLEEIIREGGGHSQMPAFEAAISPADIDTLARYVSNPPSEPAGPSLFSAHCTSCHATRVPSASDFETARATIALGGAHQDMPAWGEILTDEQVDALVDYVETATKLPDLGEAEGLFLQNCASCHGNLGEGGPNPTRASDIIAPISTAEYLATRDDATLEAIIAQGQPNFGMSPFGDSFGGPLTSEQIDLLVSYLRKWQEDPPVDLPPEVPSVPGSTDSAQDVYVTLCSQCHGESGEGGVGPAFDSAWQGGKSDEEVFNDINLGHPATAMIAWGEILTSQQIEDLVSHLRTLTGEPGTGGALTYVSTIQPIFAAYCTACHGSRGGWTGTTYEEVLNSGANGPTIIPGDPANSRLAQSLLGTHPDGIVMPPAVKMKPSDIQKIIDWIAAGAPER
jgi:mono/diheme cytochrome c family protein